MPVSTTDLLALLRQHTPTDREEATHVATTIDFVQRHPDRFYQRETLEGQVTASAWLINPARNRVLLIHHRKLDRWLQPGGHVDATDDSLLEAALREVQEETGLSGQPVSEALFDVDVHPIPERKGVPAHRHFDLRFLIEVDDTDTLTEDRTEVKDVQWFSAAELRQLTTERSVLRMLEKS